VNARNRGRQHRLVARLALCAATLAAGTLTAQQATAIVPSAMSSAMSGAMPGAIVPGAVEPVRTGGAVLSAGSAQLQGLVFAGVVTVPTPTGEVQALKLTGTAATLTGLSLATRCAPTGLGTGLQAEVTSPAGATSVVGGFTMHTTSISGTAGDTPIAWTPASPPPAPQLGDPALTDLVVELTGLETTSLEVPGLAEATSFCVV
jgi:hypothetical protein